METKDFVLGFAAGKAQGGGGGDEPTGTVEITTNGNHNVKQYATAAVNVPNSYAASDEGKVVNNGALAAQTAHSEINENGTYDTTLNDEVTVNISGGSGNILSGTTPPASSLGNNGDVYKRYFPIPSNVTFVEYLESSGTQYINTGIYATQDIDAIVTGDRQSGSSNTGCMLGVRTGSWSAMATALYFGSHNDYSSGISVIKTNSSNVGSFDNVSGVSTRRTRTINDNSGYYTYLSTIDESPSYAKLYHQSGEWRSNMPLCMFAYYSGTTLNTSSSTRVIRVTILDKNIPIADYLPCLDGNGVACMWDNISEEYVYNDGTGDFAYGSTITPDPLDDVYYLKENGAWHVIQQ